MRLLFFAILNLLINTYFSLPSFAIDVGDKVLDISFGRLGDRIVELSATKRNYQRYMNDKKFRSIEQTNAKVVLVDEDGKTIESAFAIFYDDAPDLHMTKEEAKNMTKKYSGIVFKLSPKAHKLQIFYKRKLQEELLISSIKESPLFKR